MHLQQRANVAQVARSLGVVDEALQFEADEPLDTDDPQTPHGRIALGGLCQQTPSKGAMCVKQIQPFCASHTVGCVLAAVAALACQAQKGMVNLVCGFGLDKKVHVLSGSHDAVRHHGQPPINVGSVPWRANMASASLICWARMGTLPSMKSEALILKAIALR